MLAPSSSKVQKISGNRGVYKRRQVPEVDRAKDAAIRSLWDTLGIWAQRTNIHISERPLKGVPYVWEIDKTRLLEVSPVYGTVVKATLGSEMKISQWSKSNTIGIAELIEKRLLVPISLQFTGSCEASLESSASSGIDSHSAIAISAAGGTPEYSEAEGTICFSEDYADEEIDSTYTDAASPEPPSILSPEQERVTRSKGKGVATLEPNIHRALTPPAPTFKAELQNHELLYSQENANDFMNEHEAVPGLVEDCVRSIEEVRERVEEQERRLEEQQKSLQDMANKVDKRDQLIDELHLKVEISTREKNELERVVGELKRDLEEKDQVILVQRQLLDASTQEKTVLHERLEGLRKSIKSISTPR
ncbi:hypothetical protein ABW19_dt0202840 [Dactylella cylindrospora]|nr:hypothetical protein ABW19_dt0202840 [Dactylella cylindrospora]